MNERDFLAQRFEAQRTRLRAVSYRMLGSLSEADDAVQEAWLRLSRSDAQAIENLDGWLTTVVARVSLNMLRARKTRREEPLEGQLPEPILDHLQSGNREQMDSDLERETDVVEEPTDFAVEPSDRLQFSRVDQSLGYAKQIFVRIRFDLRG